MKQGQRSPRVLMDQKWRVSELVTKEDMGQRTDLEGQDFKGAHKKGAYTR